MSALGQKQTYAVHKLMSALPPASGHLQCSSRCPLWANRKTLQCILRGCQAIATEVLLLDRLQYESLESSVAHDAVIPSCVEAHDLPGAVEIDGNDATFCRACVVRPLEAAALITTDDVHHLSPLPVCC